MTTVAAKPIKPVQALVAFIDILGFAERVRRVKNTKDLQAIADAVAQVQREFEATRLNPRPDDRALLRYQAKRVLAFSDCVVVSMGTDSGLTRQEGTYDPLMIAVHGRAPGRDRPARA